jgi:hypothetical protein
MVLPDWKTQKRPHANAAHSSSVRVTQGEERGQRAAGKLMLFYCGDVDSALQSPGHVVKMMRVPLSSLAKPGEAAMLLS